MEHDSETAESLDRTPSLDVGSALEGQEPSNAELAAALRHAADQGRLPSGDLRNLVAKRIEQAELASLLALRRA
jgi:hypothetical protein